MLWAWSCVHRPVLHVLSGASCGHRRPSCSSSAVQRGPERDLLEVPESRLILMAAGAGSPSGRLYAGRHARAEDVTCPQEARRAHERRSTAQLPPG